MRVSTLSTVALSLAGVASAHDFSVSSDADSSVWDAALEGTTHVTRSTDGWNRPVKRQSGWSPPANLATPLKQVWDHCLSTYSGGLFGFRNYGWDQLMAPASHG